MYSEIKSGTVEKQELARQLFVKMLKDNPHLSKDACWAKAKADNPKLFGDLQAADWMEEDKAEEREQKENPNPQPNRFNYYHGDMQPPSGSQNPYSTLAEHMAYSPSTKVQRRLKPPTMKDSSVLVAFQIRFSKGKQKLISQTRSRVPDDARAIARVTLADARQIRGRVAAARRCPRH